MTFTEHLDKKNKECNCGIFGVPTTDKEAFNFICDYLLGKDWANPNPISYEQINTEMTHEILYKYSKKYRKEYKNFFIYLSGRKRGKLMIKEKLMQFIRKIFKIHSPSTELTQGYVYVERDTKCDLCEYLNECIDVGNVLDCTHSMDTRKHYIHGMGPDCKSGVWR